MVTSPYFTQLKICPACQAKFQITRVRSSAYSVLKRDTDFHITYSGVNPTYYTIWVCPECQYAAPDRSFDEALRPAELDRLKKGLPLLKGEEPDFSGERAAKLALRTYELAIRSAQLRSAGPGFQGGLFLKAAWLCRELDDPQLELEYLAQACQLYEKSFYGETGGAGKLSEAGLMYLVGELYRRTGDYSQAVQWFSRAVSHPNIKREAEIERLSRDQWVLSREQAKDLPNNSEANSPPMEADAAATAEVAAQTILQGNQETTKPVFKKNRLKNKLFASLYTDQIEWLQKISNACHEQKQAFVEREAVIRAAIDALMVKFPEVDPCSSEDQLREYFINGMN